VDHSFAHVFSAGLPAVVPESDFVRGTIVLNDDGMIDGNVGNPLLEVGHRISAGCHEFDHQLIGPGNRTLGVIYEL
jgi:hypothetical protein